ncbi:MAG: hypothetical protein Q7R41_12530 [Phycisphaerales bacterium]|nr:hypothetical protein [Phycisphaerales bacterium]
MKRWIVGLAVVMLLAAAIGVAWRVLPQRRVYLTDAGTIKEPLATAPVRDVLWEPPTRLSDRINTGAEDYEPRISADGMTLFFVRGKAGQDADIFSASRTPQGWSNPEPLTAINSEADDLGPQPSADGETIYFYSNRAGGLGGYDLWVSRRGTGGDWRTPENLDPAVNSEFNDYGPALTPDEQTLYFSSNRPQPGDVKTPDPNAWPATLRENNFHRTYDLYAAAITDQGVTKAEPVNSLNTPYNEGAPAVSSFGDFLYFASDRPGGSGGFDLYRSRRLGGGHGAATNLGGAVNTPFNELDPALSMGGFGLDFSSDRALGDHAADAPREYNLYHTNSREVFAESEAIDRPPIDWAGLWATVGPNLFWALFALTLLSLMLLLFKSARHRKLSLLARCLAASLAAHALLMLLFNVWHVAAALAGEVHRNGPIRISLAGAGHGDAITAQIRGNLTEFDAPRPAHTAANRQMIPLTALVVSPRTDIPVEHQPIDISATVKVDVTVADAVVHQREPSLPVPRIGLIEPARAPEVSIPSEAKRFDAAEPDAAAQARPVAPPVARTIKDYAEAVPARAERWLLPPGQTDVTAGSASRSLASIAAMREAAPALEPAIGHTPSPLRLAGAMPAAEPRLPEAPERRRAAESEYYGVQTAEVPLSARAVPAESAGSLPYGPLVATFKPAQAAAPTPDIRLVANVSPSVPDSPPPLPKTTRSGSVNPADRMPPARVAEAELAISTMQQARAAGQGEVEPVLAFGAAAPAMARISTDALVGSAHRPGDHPVDLPLMRVRAPGTSSGSLVGSSPFAADAEPRRDALGRRHAPPALDLAANSISLNSDFHWNLDREPAPAVEQSIGTVRGKVTEAGAGRAIGEATVQLVLPDRPPLTAVTDSKGRYSLAVPPMPEFFALSASGKGFVPATTNMKRSDFEGRGEVVADFKLERERPTVSAVEAVPDVHHLGDDRFDGAINSQFQKTTEGSSFAATFEVDRGLLKSPIDHAELRLLVKGVQRRHRIYINDHLLAGRLDESPEDGSFGEFVAAIDASILKGGANTLRIVAAPSTADIDDFEFVNIRIYLIPLSRANAAGL